jgi:hypothetical protein
MATRWGVQAALNSEVISDIEASRLALSDGRVHLWI